MRRHCRSVVGCTTRCCCHARRHGVRHFSSAATTTAPDVARELQFTVSEFTQSNFDLDQALLQEAHRKHGVFLNVPPQLPPKNDPPEVPVPIFCESQRMRLASLKLAYAPMHEPPPLSTTGTRGLDAMIVEPVKKASPGAPEQAASPKGTSSGVSQGSEAAGLKPVSVDYRKLDCLTLPTEDDIDALLREVWDPIGRAASATDFQAFSDTTVGVADNRASQPETKPSARATPEGVAPGVKRVAVGSSSPSISLKEMSARFPNPFGESAEAKLLELLKLEPVNPFVPDPNSETTPRPSLAAAQQPRFQCHVCLRPFRLQDALLDHLQEQHDVILTEEEVEARYGDARRTNPFLMSPQSTPCATPTDSTSSSVDVKSELEAAGIAPEDSQGLPPTPVEEHAVQVHLRAATNCTLMGEIVDIQTGFWKSLKVTQIVVRTGVSSVQMNQEDTDAKNAEEEFHVVRILGEQLKFAADALRVGEWVTVVGQLRMNRHVDDASRRSHAYPFVQVHSPFGTVLPLEGPL